MQGCCALRVCIANPLTPLKSAGAAVIGLLPTKFSGFFVLILYSGLVQLVVVVGFVTTKPPITRFRTQLEPLPLFQASRSLHRRLHLHLLFRLE